MRRVANRLALNFCALGVSRIRAVLGAEVAALEAWRRSGLRVIVARSFAHTGPGQEAGFVIPAFAQRLLFAKKIGAPVVKVGNLEPVRDLLHVQDVVDAYVRLLRQGEAGEVYNIASGHGTRLEDVLFRMAELLGVRAIPEADPELMRPADIPHLVGDGEKSFKESAQIVQSRRNHPVRDFFGTNLEEE